MSTRRTVISLRHTDSFVSWAAAVRSESFPAGVAPDSSTLIATSAYIASLKKVTMSSVLISSSGNGPMNDVRNKRKLAS